jgi:hypothetical protein
MIKMQAERLLARILTIGASFTTIFVLSGNITDPVNVTKLFSLGVVAIAALSVLLFSDLKARLRNYRSAVIVTLFFVLAAFNSIIFSASPFSQNFYGAYGRNNGFLTYAFLAVILLGSLSLTTRTTFNSVLVALFVAGLVNIVYCLWVISFGDFVGWSNPYGNILGTLGNPNFIGSFLGIFLAAFVAFAAAKNAPRLYRYGSLIVVPLTAFEIIDSHAIQGRVVAVLGIGIVIFYQIRSRFSNAILWLYVAFAASVGTIALLGALQIGPLTKYIYKTSVSLRGQYWLSGWNAGESHLFTGVGMDSLGDWYRRSRDAHALEVPGVNTVVNAAHNVVLDMFAFGGLPLLLSYVILIGLVFVAILRVTLRTKDFDPVFVALVTAWIGYQVQSIISINQIGLAVWGWLLSGTILAFERTTRFTSSDNKDSSKLSGKGKPASQNLHLTMVATFGAVVGIIIAIPPLIADSKWRSAQVAQSLPQTEASMVSSYFNPMNTGKYLVNIQTLESSQLFDLSHKYALDAVKWNADVFELWKTLYFLKNTTAQEKEEAVINMKRLDPLNPDVTALT